ncbi:MAG: GNAT family N-acetyltransferase [Defluviitaleaceae bacterium]|nr:GNAT family N-acetyltransferase [Defluviitaleaceae bacterium]
MITIEKAVMLESEKLHKMQVTAFSSLPGKYQDHDINPETETVEQFRARFLNAKTHHYRIQLNKECIGYARVVMLADNGYKLSSLFILPAYQGNGYSTQAIEGIKSIYPQAKKWTLTTICDN